MSGQSITDRVIAAKHSIAGQGLAKSVCKATTEEVMGPKKKHLDYLLQCTNEPNVSIPQLADLLITRTQHQNWVTVFKSLITIHNLMNFGNERFTQYLASNNCKFNLSGFLDKAGVAGYDMSTFIRRYAKYLNEKSYSYRMMAFDFCKVKRGKEDGMLRTMNGEKLLKTLPILQSQLDALLEFDCTANELTNGVINACFMLIFKDLIRLFACYNDGIINLLEKYFEMNKKQCKEALDLYKKFLVRMDKVSEFLKTAENVGIDKGDIPDLAKAPSSLLDALEQHLASLESTKKSGAPPSKPKGVQSAIQSFANGRGQITEEEKRKVLEEEQMRLNQLKEAKMREAQAAAGSPVSQPPAPIITQQQQPNLFGSPTNSVPAPVAAPAAQPASLNNANTTTTTSSNIDFFAAPPAQVQLAAPTQQPAQQQQSVVVAPAQPAPAKPMDDLLSLSGTSAFSENIMANQPTPGGATNAFQPVSTPAAVVLSPVAPVAPVANILSPGDQWSPPPAATGTSNNTSGSFSADFAAVFGNTEPAGPGFDGFGEVLQPKGNQGMARGTQAKDEKLIKGNLDESLASLAGNLNIKSPAHQVKKQQHQWKPSERNQKTGGANWNAPTISSATSWGGQPPVYQTGGSTQPPMTTMSSGMGMGQPGVMGMQQQRPMGMGMGIGVQQPMGAMAGQPHQQQNMFQQPLSQTQQQPSPADDPFGSL